MIQAINAYKEIEKERNLVFERLEEWYGIYFPELRLSNQGTYAKFVMDFGMNKKNATPEALKATLGEKSSDIHKVIMNSIGNEPSHEVYEMLNMYASLLLQLIKVQENLDEYLKSASKAIMPNISFLVDYRLAAELLSKAGSLQRLSTMPASTIQLLGAEKALFKHIKFGSKSPKYGILFRMQIIQSANKEDRGRIARMYATKLSIAARADGISKRFIANKLKEDLDKKIQMMSKRMPKGRPKYAGKGRK